MDISRIILISKFINSGYNKISLFDAQRLCEIVLINPKEPDMSLRKKLGYRSFSLRRRLKINLLFPSLPNIRRLDGNEYRADYCRVSESRRNHLQKQRR